MRKVSFIPKAKNVKVNGKPLTKYPKERQLNVLRSIALEEMRYFILAGGHLSYEEWSKLSKEEWQLMKKVVRSLHPQIYYEAPKPKLSDVWAAALEKEKEQWGSSRSQVIRS